MNSSKNLYFDFAATGPVWPEVVEAMLPTFTETFGNSMSDNHDHGWQAQKCVEKARLQIAQALGSVTDYQIVFTSGATESNNWVFESLAQQAAPEASGKPIHFLVSPLEHKSVFNGLREDEKTLSCGS